MDQPCCGARSFRSSSQVMTAMTAMMCHHSRLRLWRLKRESLLETGATHDLGWSISLFILVGVTTGCVSYYFRLELQTPSDRLELRSPSENGVQWTLHRDCDLHPGGCSCKVVISSHGVAGRRSWKANGLFLILLYGCWRHLINSLSVGRSLYLLAGLCSDVAVGGSPCQWEILLPCS